MIKEIPLQNGIFAIVDEEDYERCMEYTWYVTYDKTGTHLSVLSSKAKKRLSYFILNSHSQKGMVLTFLNRDQLDHRKENLIWLTSKQASQRRRNNRNSTSLYKGVTRREESDKWIANIYTGNQNIFLGHFDWEDDAAEAYNFSALKHFGEHAYQNIIGEDNAPPLLEQVTGYPRRIPENKNTASIYRGVVRNKQGAGWMTYCSKVYLGAFTSDIDAAIAYNEKAIEIYGDKAILNTIPEGHIPTGRVPAKDSKEYMAMKGFSSSYNGVSWDKNREKWFSSIRRNKKNVFQKRFNTELEAAQAYDKKAYELDGEKANLNFPELIDEYKKEL